MRIQFVSPCYLLPLLAFLLLGCGSSKPMERPEESYEERRPVEPSVINIPVRLQVADFERSLNSRLNGVLYDDRDLDDGDNMMLRASKQGDIRLKIDSQQITYRLPLALWVKYDAGITNLEATGDIALEFRTRFQIRPDWKISTQTEMTGHQWIRQPRLQMGVVNLPVGALLDLILRNSRGYLTQKIDNLVAESFNLQQIVDSVWKQMYQPIQLSSEYGAWLIANPQRLAMTPLRAENGQVSSTIVIESKPEIKLGMRPADRIPPTLPKLALLSATDPRDSFILHLDTEIPYEEAERLAREQLLGETFRSGKRSVRVENIDIYGSGKKLVVSTSLSGSYRGNVYLEGEPVYNQKKNTVEVRDLEFTLSTRNVLYKSAGWLLKSTVKRQIQDNLQFLLDYNLGEMKTQLQQQLENYPLMETIRLSGQLQELNIRQVYLTRQTIVVDVGLRGKINLLVNGLH